MIMLLVYYTITNNDLYIFNHTLIKYNLFSVYIIDYQSIEELEKELLNGQKLQGPITAAEVNFMLKNKNMENE